MVQPPSTALKEQGRVSLRAALTEIEELKQSQRCVEISLAKQIEENEQLTLRLSNGGSKIEQLEEQLAKQIKENEEKQFMIDALNKKIAGFSKNQDKVSGRLATRLTLAHDCSYRRKTPSRRATTWERSTSVKRS